MPPENYISEMFPQVISRQQSDLVMVYRKIKLRLDILFIPMEPYFFGQMKNF